MRYVIGPDHEGIGPRGVCAACAVPGPMYMHFANGWCCRSCVLSASTIIEVRWINGVKYTRLLKGTNENARLAADASLGK